MFELGASATLVEERSNNRVSEKKKHDLIKNRLIDLIENMFRGEEVLNLACNAKCFFFHF